MKRPAIVLTLAAVLPFWACGSGEDASASVPVEVATKSTQGEVSFELTPRTLADGGLEVSVQANTHSGDLGQLDLRTAMTLEAAGRTWAPVEATALAGHHAAATVRFDVSPPPDRFAVTLSGVRSMPAQRIEWP